MWRIFNESRPTLFKCRNTAIQTTVRDLSAARQPLSKIEAADDPTDGAGDE